MREKQLPFVLRAARVLVCTWAALFALLFAACALPGERVLANAAASARIISQEGLYPEYCGFKLFQMDNYTDTLMLFAAAAADESAPLGAMMTSTVYNIDNFETLADDLAAYCARRTAADGAQDSGDLTPFSYARYWHGYLIWLRPLLCVTTITGVRAVQYAVLFGLLAAVLALLRRRVGVRAAVLFAVSQALVTVWWVPRQVQFFTTFAVGLAGCVWVLAKPRRADALCLCLAALGTVTAFCDLLVTPAVTFGLPLAVWLVQPQQRLRGGVRQCGAVLAGCLCWGVGYALCWASKWVLASAVTGQNVVADAVRQMAVRTSADTWHGIELTWGNLIAFVWGALAERRLLVPLALALALGAAAFAVCVRGKAPLVRALPLGLTAALPLLWFAVFRTHSVQHGWFAWRALCVTFFAGAAFVYNAAGLKTGLRRVLGKRGENGRA